MKKFMLATLAMIMILTLSAFSVQVRQAQAAPELLPGPNVRVLNARLSRPAIDGAVPDGLAQFIAVQGGTSLSIGISNLNLPDGTCLDAAFGRTVLRLGVVFGNANTQLSPSPEAIRLGEDITISISPVQDPPCGGVLGRPLALTPATGTVILSGTFQEGSGTK